MRKSILVLLSSVLLTIFTMPNVHAHCPLCTMAVGTAVISAKYYGLDSTIIGLLVGGFGVSTGLWVGLKIKRHFKFQLGLIVFLSFILTVIPLLYLEKDSIYFPLLLIGQEGSFLNKVYWINKMLFGSIIGGVVTLLSYLIHAQIKKVNGRVLFPFQGVVFNLASLVISGLGLYFLFK